MAINLTTPRGEGYQACLRGHHISLCPFGIDQLVQWDEWINGWYEAYNSGLFAKDVK